MEHDTFEDDFNRFQSGQWLGRLRDLEAYTIESKLPLNRQEYLLYRGLLIETYKDILESSGSRDISLTSLLDGSGEIFPLFQQKRIATFETQMGMLEPAMLIIEKVSNKAVGFGDKGSRPTLYDILLRDSAYLDTMFDYSDVSERKNRKVRKYKKLIENDIEQSAGSYFFALAPLCTSSGSSCKGLTLETENNIYYGDKEYLEMFMLPNNPTCREDLQRLNLLNELIKYSSPEK